jgi:hypothetical protein
MAILMYQMRILIIYISSVMLRLNKMEVRNVMAVKTLETKTKSCEMGPKPLKDRAIREGDNPSI